MGTRGRPRSGHPCSVPQLTPANLRILVTSLPSFQGTMMVQCHLSRVWAVRGVAWLDTPQYNEPRGGPRRPHIGCDKDGDKGKRSWDHDDDDIGIPGFSHNGDCGHHPEPT